MQSKALNVKNETQRILVKPEQHSSEENHPLLEPQDIIFAH